MNPNKLTEEAIARPSGTNSPLEMGIMAAALASSPRTPSNHHGGKYLPKSAAKIVSRKAKNRAKNKAARKARKKNR